MTTNILQYTPNGTYMNFFHDIDEIEETLNITTKDIEACLEKRKCLAGGYRWSYDLKESPHPKIYQFSLNERRLRKEVIRKYNSIQEVAEEMNVIPSLVVEAISTYSNINGYQFDWSDGVIRTYIVGQYNNGVRINDFDTVKDASKHMKCHSKLIKRAISTGGECSGFQWTYEFDTIPIPPNPFMESVIVQYSLTGNKLGVYRNIDVIICGLWISENSIRIAIRRNRPIQGYLFKRELVSSHDSIVKLEKFVIKNLKRYTLSGQYIKRYFTVDTAINEEHLSRKELINSIINRTPYRDSLWCYDGEEHDLPFRVLRRYDKDGVKIDEFNTIKEAIEKTGIPEHKIKRALKEERYTCKTFWVWEKPDFKREENSKFVGPPRVAVETIKPPLVRLNYGLL